MPYIPQTVYEWPIGASGWWQCVWSDDSTGERRVVARWWNSVSKQLCEYRDGPPVSDPQNYARFSRLRSLVFAGQSAT
jgi:hypothetical protein